MCSGSGLTRRFLDQMYSYSVKCSDPDSFRRRNRGHGVVFGQMKMKPIPGLKMEVYFPLRELQGYAIFPSVNRRALPSPRSLLSAGARRHRPSSEPGIRLSWRGSSELTHTHTHTEKSGMLVRKERRVCVCVHACRTPTQAGGLHSRGCVDSISKQAVPGHLVADNTCHTWTWGKESK